MNVTHLLTQCGVLTRVHHDGPPDEYNNPTERTEAREVRCWAEQRQAHDDTTDTHQLTDVYRIYLEPLDDLTGWDRLAIGGAVYEFHGPPWPAVSPRTRQTTHVEVTGRYVQ